MARLSRSIIDNFASSGMAHVKITNILLGVVIRRKFDQKKKDELIAGMQGAKMTQVAFMAKKLRLVAKVKAQYARL